MKLLDRAALRAVLAVLAALPAGTAAGGADRHEVAPAADRQEINRLVDRQLPAIARNSKLIWDYAETAFAETKSSALLQDALRKAGFSVEAGVAGMPTAFVARYALGKGPVIALLAEFDALPGASQKAGSAFPDPMAGRHAGHACGHNLLGAGSIGAAVAISQWMKHQGLAGEIRVYGTPAEERGDGKTYMVREGLFGDVDAVVHWHPTDRNGIFNQPTQANIKTRFTFRGLASHAAAAPERGRSALAGVQLMDVGVNYMRQFVPDGTRIHGIVTEGGTAPNVIPAIARSVYYVRNGDVAVLRSLQDRLLKVAQGAATATETDASWDIEGGVHPLLINQTLARMAYDTLLPEAAALERSDEEKAYSDAIRLSLRTAEPDVPPSHVEPFAAQGTSAGSTDVGDISQVVPTVGIITAAWPRGVSPHSWAAASASGSRAGLPATVAAARTISNLAIALMRSPDRLVAARRELNASRNGDLAYRPLFEKKAPPATSSGD